MKGESAAPQILAMVAPKGVQDKLGQYWTTLLFACTYFPIAFTCILTLSPFGVRARAIRFQFCWCVFAHFDFTLRAGPEPVQSVPMTHVDAVQSSSLPPRCSRTS